MPNILWNLNHGFGTNLVVKQNTAADADPTEDHHDQSVNLEIGLFVLKC